MHLFRQEGGATWPASDLYGSNIERISLTNHAATPEIGSHCAGLSLGTVSAPPPGRTPVARERAAGCHPRLRLACASRLRGESGFDLDHPGASCARIRFEP